MKWFTDTPDLDVDGFKHIGNKKIRLYGGGGGGKTTSYSTNLPEFARPFYQELLTQTGKSIFERDAEGNVTGVKKFNPYQGERIAGFTDAEQAVRQQMLGLETPEQFAQATQGLAGLQADSAAAAGAGIAQAFGYQPGQFNSGYQARDYGGANISSRDVMMPSLQDYQMSGVAGISPSALQNYSMRAAQSTYDPRLEQLRMEQIRDVQAPSLQQFAMQGAQTNYRPDLEQYQMTAPEDVAVAERATTESITEPGALEKFMSPYQQAVTDAQIREAQRQAAIQKKGAAMGAIQRGTFGGARQALLQSEQDRNTQQLLADIQARGSQAGYEAGVKGFESEQARKSAAQQINIENQMRAALANQQAGLTTGQANLQALLGVQQLGTETNLQTQLANLSNEQQSRVQNLASQLQTQGLSADQSLRAALANQQTQFNVGQQNLQSALATQQLQTQTGREMALANMNAQQQANVQNLAAQLQTQGLSAEQAMQAAIQNQQAALTTGQQNLQARLQTQQLNTEASLRAQQANQQASLDAQRIQEQARQFGLNLSEESAYRMAQTNLEEQRLRESAAQYQAGLGKDIGLASMGYNLEASKGLGALATAEQRAELERLAAQGDVAAQERLMEQQQLDLDYQQAMEARDYERSLLEYYSNILRGNAGALGSTQVQYAQQPGIAQQLAGLGIAGLGAYMR